MGERVADRRAAILYHGIFATGVPYPFFDLVKNFERIFVSGVVAGQNDQVGQFPGDLAHDRALAVVAVAAAAEEAMRRPLVVWRTDFKMFSRLSGECG